MKLLILIALVAGLALAACGGGDDGERVLRLGSGDMTEAEFRLEVRVLLAEPDAEASCRLLNGLSDAEAVDVIVATAERAGTLGDFQEARQEDRERAAAIVKEECKRIF